MPAPAASSSSARLRSKRAASGIQPTANRLAWQPAAWLLLALLTTGGCRSLPKSGRPILRNGDEIVICGQLFHTGTPVVTWLDPGGYDAYRVERKFVSPEKADWKTSQTEVPALESPNRYGFRRGALIPPGELDRVRTNGWDLPTLRCVVDQFVLHYDACGTSRRCFQVLHDERGLSVHFLLDIDGTIYQTLDLKERAWHATTANTRALGIEIAHVGAVPLNQTNRLSAWYAPEPKGPPRLTIPEWIGTAGVRTPGFVGHPARPQPVVGRIQDETLLQYDFTPQQYAALTKLTATLCRVFPKIRCDYPRDSAGQVITRKLTDPVLADFHGVLGHFHIQTEKTDPGPAFDWERFIRGARAELRH